ARDDVEDGGLARAVGADDGDDLSGLHREGHAVEGDDAAEADAQLTNFEQRHCSPQSIDAAGRWLLVPWRFRLFEIGRALERRPRRLQLLRREVLRNGRRLRLTLGRRWRRRVRAARQ